MIELKLRDEFRGKRLQGTTVNLTAQAKTGTIEVPAGDFLRITYPSFDLLKTIEATGGPPTIQAGRFAWLQGTG